MTNTVSLVNSGSYSGASSKSVAFASALTNPSIMVVVATQEINGGTFAVSDDVNGSWGATNKVTNAGGGGSGEGTVLVQTKQNASTSTPNVTVTLGGSTYGFVGIFQITGGPTSSELGATQAGSDTGGATDDSITLAAGAANSTLVRVGTFYGGAGAVDTGYTQIWALTALNNSYHFAEYIADGGASGNKVTTFNDTSVKNNWCGLAVEILTSAGGGGGTTRGTPFGHRGTAFNGGRTFHGIIQRLGLWLPQPISLRA